MNKPSKRTLAQARRLLARLKPFDEWKAEQPRSKHDIEIYHLIDRNLRRVIAAGENPNPGPLIDVHAEGTPRMPARTCPVCGKTATPALEIIHPKARDE